MSEDPMWRTQEEQELAALRNERDKAKRERDRWKTDYQEIREELHKERQLSAKSRARLDAVLAIHCPEACTHLCDCSDLHCAECWNLYPCDTAIAAGVRDE